MNINVHQNEDIRIAEVVSDAMLIRTPEDGLQLMIDLYYQDYDRFILHRHQITPDFFELKTGIAGEILQKFTNYRVRVVIVGDFSEIDSKSLRDFILESNKGRQINFLPTVEQAVERLSAG